MEIQPNKQTIFRNLRDGLSKSNDFEAYLAQKIVFDGREWTAGQFLYKYCFDEWQPFAYYVRDHFDSLSGQEKELAEKIKRVMEEGLTKPKYAYQFVKKGKSLGLFDADKQAFYQSLLTGSKRSVKGNPCLWHPVSQCQTAFVAYELSQMGMTEKQIESLMRHCEQEREKAEEKAIQNMPTQFTHNTVLPPEEMKKGKIDLFVRSDDQFLNFQKLAFIGEPGCFHAGLPFQSATSFRSWPRFNPDIVVFQIDREEAKKQISHSYTYLVDMAQKEDFRPCIPLWGGEPLEWVSVRPLKYTGVKKETLQDLMKQGKEIYLVPREEDWKAYIERNSAASPEEARAYLADLAAKKPKKVMKIDETFLAEYEAEFPSHEAERKKRRSDRIKGISLRLQRNNVRQKKANAQQPTRGAER